MSEKPKNKTKTNDGHDLVTAPGGDAGARTEPMGSGGTVAPTHNGGTAEAGGATGREAAGSARTATVNLPFVTAEFRAPEMRMPEMRMPDRDDVNGLVEGARSWLPAPTSALFFGGLAVTVVLGAIEWPVAAAIGVGSALASRGSAEPVPREHSATSTSAGTAGQGR